MAQSQQFGTSLVVLGAGDDITGINAGRHRTHGAQFVGLCGGAGHPEVLADNHVAGAVLQQVHPAKSISKIRKDVVGDNYFLNLFANSTP